MKANWTTILVGGGLVVAVIVLLVGSRTINATVGFDPGDVTVTPTNTNTSGQGTP